MLESISYIKSGILRSDSVQSNMKISNFEFVQLVGNGCFKQINGYIIRVSSKIIMPDSNQRIQEVLEEKISKRGKKEMI